MVYKLADELVQDDIPNLKFSNPNYYLYGSINDYKDKHRNKINNNFNLDEVYFCFQNYGKPHIEKSKISLMMFKQINDDIYMELLEEKDLEFSSITKEILNYQ